MPDGLPGARLELKPGNISLVTAGGGAFTFRNVPPGRYTISVQRDGFVVQEDRRRGITETGITVTVAADQIVKGIVLPMIPAPVIIGRVFDPHGEALAAGLVAAYQRQYTPYGTKLKIVKKGMTNDMGAFRLFGLNFGEYFVSGAYSDRDRAAALGKTHLSPNVSNADDGYATTFYNGSEDMSRAVPVRLAPGSNAPPLNVYLRDADRFRIRGKILPIIRGTKITLAPRGSDLTDADYSITPDAKGEFEIRGVSPGTYLLLATGADGESVLESEVISVNVTDRDIDGVILALEKTISVSGELGIEDSPGEDLSSYHVTLLRSATEFDQKIDTRVSRDGTFTLEHVARRADYDIVVEPLPSGTYVKTMLSGIRDLLPGKVRLLADETLHIVVAPAKELLDVHVFAGRNPVAGTQVVLIPDPRFIRRADRYITDFTDDSGNLNLTAVPPGRYTAYAFEEIERSTYYALPYSPAAEERLRDRALPVTLPVTIESSKQRIELRVIPAAETVGGFP